MANYHFNTSFGNISKTSAHASYILAKDKYSYKENEILFADSKLPPWAKNENEFWGAVCEFERANGRGYREFRFSLPNELSVDENISLVNDFIKNTLNDKFYYTVAIHNKEVNSFEKSTQNIHCHLMFNERKIDGIERTAEQFFKRANVKNPHNGGCKKSTEFNPKEKLLELRKDMEVLVNSYYEKNGFEERVTCKSLEKQKELAEQENDLLKAELYDRDPIDINGYLLKKPIDKMTKEERDKFELFNLTIKIRNLKEMAYSMKIEQQRFEAVEKSLERDKDINLKNYVEYTPENVFDEYISNEKNIIDIEKEIIKNKNNLNDIELKTIFTLDKETYNVYCSKELLEKELFVMENYSIKNEIHFNKRFELEEKIFKYDTALEISISQYKESKPLEFEKQKDILTNEYEEKISVLEINKLNFQNLNNELIKNVENNNGYGSNSFEDNIEYNLKEYLTSKNDLKVLDSKISKIENQLINENLRDITLNKITNGKLADFENKQTLFDKEIKNCDIRINSTNDKSKIDLHLNAKELYKEKLNNLIKEFEPIYNSIDKEKYNKLKASLEIKLKNNLLNLKEERNSVNNIVAIKKSNFIKTDLTKEFLNKNISNTEKKLESLEDKIRYCKTRIGNTREFYSNEKIIELATAKVYKGENIKLMREYDKINDFLDILEEKIKNTGTLNILLKFELNKEKKNLEQKLNEVNSKYKNLTSNMSKENFKSSIDSILLSKEKAITAIVKYETSFNKQLGNAKSELYNITSLKQELYPYKNLEAKHENINFNKLIDHARTGGGGQERIESFFDDLERKNKKKSRDFEI